MVMCYNRDMKKALTRIVAGVVVMMGVVATSAMAGFATTWAEGETVTLTDSQKNSIVQNCDVIHEQLVNLQHMDSRTRVYLGRYYETILTDYVTPLNVWLVANSMANAGLIDNQNSFTTTRGKFVSDYIVYQKELEALVGMDCKVDATKFYDKLVMVRKAREVVEKDTTEMRKLMDEQMELVEKLKESL